MIQLFSGTPGSGKSLHAAHEIEKDLKFGKNVISTMLVDTDLCFYNGFQRFIFNHFGKRPKKFKRDKRQNHFHYIDNRNLTPEYLYSFAINRTITEKTGIKGLALNSAPVRGIREEAADSKRKEKSESSLIFLVIMSDLIFAILNYLAADQLR